MLPDEGFVLVVPESAKLGIELGEAVSIDAVQGLRAWHVANSDVMSAFGRVVVLLDRFILLVPDGQSQREAFYAAFFDWIAADYVGLVDMSRNKANIKTLARFIQEFGIDTSVDCVLDFGCGPGLALGIAELGDGLLGFDVSRRMRDEARRSGMVVLEPHELAALPLGALRAAFASYVLHTETSRHFLLLAASRIAPEGVFAANFHKNRGIEWTTEALGELGFQPVREQVGSSHGSYVVFRR